MNQATQILAKGIAHVPNGEIRIIQKVTAEDMQKAILLSFAIFKLIIFVKAVSRVFQIETLSLCQNPLNSLDG
jgi:hypothetical protein